MATATATPRNDDTNHNLEAEAAVLQLLRALGEDAGREGLLKTPRRVANALAFLTSGSALRPEDVLNGAVFTEEYRGIVLVRDIEFHSLCEHHMLPFVGRAHLAYLPAGKVIGLSKLPRLLDVFARRLSVQERLTAQVAEAIEEAIAPTGVAVMVEAVHFCMAMRGVGKQRPRTVTTSFRGAFARRASLRREFLLAAGCAAGERPAPLIAGEPRRGRRREAASIARFTPRHSA